jgi:hypothetical protein
MPTHPAAAAHPAAGDTVTVACYAVNSDGLDAHGRTGSVVAGPRGDRDRDLYDVKVPGWGVVQLAEGELRRIR